MSVLRSQYEKFSEKITNNDKFLITKMEELKPEPTTNYGKI